MADKSAKSSPSGAAGGVPAVDRPTDIRNVVLVGHSGSGKTTLLESMLLAGGAITRAGRVEDGTTVSDHDDAEARQCRSVNLAVAPLMLGGVKVNLLDTPGYADYVGDLRAGLRAADAALFVISAVDGIDGPTKILWEECAAVGMPRAVVINKIDHQRADFFQLLAECQDAFGEGVMPVYYPVGGGEEPLRGLVGLLSGRLLDYSSGERVEADPGEELLDRLTDLRNALIEGVITESEDEALMERYVEGGEIDAAALIPDLHQAVARGGFYPVLAVSATRGVGVAELLEALPQACPAPTERPLPPVTRLDGEPVAGLGCDPDGPLLAEVVKTTTDPYVGRISLVRVFSGTLRPDSTVHVSGHGPAERGRGEHDVDERIGALSVPLGKQMRPVPRVVAGDVCAVAKLSRAETGDTLSDREAPLLMPAWTFPEPLLPVALRAAVKADEDKLAQALARVSSEDVTLRLEVNAETRQLVLWCMGEAHLEVIVDRLADRYGVRVETSAVRVPLRETFTSPAHGMGRNVKQTGGHGEYGVCRIEVEPLPSGAGLEFVDKIVGGVVPRQFIPSVEKGVRAQMEQGLESGYPCVDIRVTLYDGKAHAVDSSDMAFQKAGRLALKDAAEHAQMAMLEPVDEVEVLVADEYVGAVMSDLSARRGRVLGTENLAGGRTLVRAEVPQLEMVRYAVELRSLAHGTGAFSRGYLRHEPLPAHVAARLPAAG
ncbi:elongation factor G-like protein EF-G2 [Allonocardiopsis opalescens]|uniref:Translation elongation factor 2 (EF-2/EF-G) n=1 Tax=Allonocardiopsis opalescens TaxID=1144618 RepID=A0A2T0PX06_9ACTN|nr:elongation factor G-like protein EF-G2 [Allonocardiopsis opalescens]PRX96065.1 translation elongation factor 2 (EF-2/EF-G) [Allonocardiopsis opalescens]